MKAVVLAVIILAITTIPVFAQLQDETEVNAPENADNVTSETNLQDTMPVQIPNLSDGFLLDYLNKLVNDITEKASFNDIIVFSAGVAAYGIFIFHFYRFIARRDIFSFDLEKRLAGGRYSADGKRSSAAPRVAAYIATKFFIFPILVFAWFLAYSMFILLLTQDLMPDRVFFVASILIIGIRMAAYYSEDLSKDLAKIIPFAILGIFLFEQRFFTIEDITVNIGYIPQFVTEIASFVIIAFVLEIILSILYLIRIKFLGRDKKGGKVESEQAV